MEDIRTQLQDVQGRLNTLRDEFRTKRNMLIQQREDVERHYHPLIADLRQQEATLKHTIRSAEGRVYSIATPQPRTRRWKWLSQLLSTMTAAQPQ